MIEVFGNWFFFIVFGIVMFNNKKLFVEWLVELYDGLSVVVCQYDLVEVVVEYIFVNKDVGVILKFGQVCGIVLLVFFLVGLSVVEYVLNLVKKIVVGIGYVEKEQIWVMVKVLMLRVMFNFDDVVDVFVIVICYV